MPVASQSALYERLFLLNRYLEQVAEILGQFQEEGLIHPEYAGHRKHMVEELRADLSYVITGLLHQKELEACVALKRTETRLDV